MSFQMNSCKDKFRNLEDEQGNLSKMWKTDHYWLQTIENTNARNVKLGHHCEAEQSAGKQTSIQHWFIAIHLLQVQKRPFLLWNFKGRSVISITNQYVYDTKLRLPWIQDSKYQLDKIVELDEAFSKSVDTKR